MDFREELMFPNLDVSDRDTLLDTLGRAVIGLGLARDDYAAALKQRELEYPTGLPISGGVAIPHTAAEYVTGNTIAAATLSRPVTFAEMGGEADSEVPVTTVFLLVFADASQHVPLLSRIIGRIQDADFVHSIRSAGNPAEMAQLLAAAFPSDQPVN